MGIFGFYDFGRVWIDGENSDIWHDSFGGGPYLAPIDFFIVAAAINISDEETLYSFRFGFTF